MALGTEASTQLGYNHNVTYGARLFHVQTEDSGLSKARLFTHIFHQGTIIASEKVEYHDLLAEKDVSKALVHRMKTSHVAMIRRLKNGEFDEKIARILGSAALAHEPSDEVAEVELSPASEPLYDEAAVAPLNVAMEEMVSAGSTFVTAEPPLFAEGENQAGDAPMQANAGETSIQSLADAVSYHKEVNVTDIPEAVYPREQEEPALQEYVSVCENPVKVLSDLPPPPMIEGFQPMVFAAAVSVELAVPAAISPATSIEVDDSEVEVGVPEAVPSVSVAEVGEPASVAEVAAPTSEAPTAVSSRKKTLMTMSETVPQEPAPKQSEAYSAQPSRGSGTLSEGVSSAEAREAPSNPSSQGGFAAPMAKPGIAGALLLPTPRPSARRIVPIGA